VLPLSVSLYVLNLNSPSGYVGGTVLSHFLAHPDVAQFNLTALVRSEEKAKKLETFGVNAVVGSLQDLELLESLASKADYVVSMVSSQLASVCTFAQSYLSLGRRRWPRGDEGDSERSKEILQR